MKTIIKSLLAVSVLLLSSCEFSTSTSSGNKTADNLNAIIESAKPIRNNITFEENGDLKVVSAFLMNDNGELIADDNTVKAGDRFKLILKLSGWKASDGKVQIGAGERLLNSNKVVMMQEDDLFANAIAISEEDAQVITLIMEVLNTETIYDYYQTEFKVWNKDVEQWIRGSYQFKLKK